MTSQVAVSFIAFALIALLGAEGQGDHPAPAIPLARLIELATAARAASEGSPTKAVRNFTEAFKREGTFQGLLLELHLEAIIEFTMDKPNRPSVDVTALQDRQIVALLMQLQSLERLTGKTPGMPPTSDVCLNVNTPTSLSMRDVERVVLMRDGRQVTPSVNTLSRTTVTSGMGVSVARHSGSICWPVVSFEPVTASPKLILFLNEGNPVEMTVSKEHYDWLTGRREGGAPATRPPSSL